MSQTPCLHARKIVPLAAEVTVILQAKSHLMDRKIDRKRACLCAQLTFDADAATFEVHWPSQLCRRVFLTC